MIKIGLIKEGKVPPDSRVVLPPKQASALMKKFPEIVIVVVEDFENRCFTNDEYIKHNIEIVNDVSDCDVLLGVKEVPVQQLIAGKTYLFFSHTIKKQEHNRILLQEVLKKKIRLIDYECLLDDKGIRLIGFGRFAGIVGAQHALIMWGKKTGRYNLKRAVEHYDLKEMISHYHNIDFGKMRIFVTGNGRVSHGVVEVLTQAGIKRLTPEDYIVYNGNDAVFCQCDMDELYENKQGRPFDFDHFFHTPQDYNCLFNRFWNSTDVLINGMFWNPSTERLFEKNDAIKPDFNVSVISDISCDINGSVPLTSHASTIDNPYFAFNRNTLELCEPFTENSIDIMTIDNLPNELPRDASEMFAEVMLEKVLPLIISDPQHPVLRHATIAENGHLTADFEYLKDFVEP